MNQIDRLKDRYPTECHGFNKNNFFSNFFFFVKNNKFFTLYTTPCERNTIFFETMTRQKSTLIQLMFPFTNTEMIIVTVA